MLRARRQPWPRELGPNTPVDRARTVARACWHALVAADPDTAEAIRAMAARFGEDVWLTPSPELAAPGERLTREQVAVRAGVTPPVVTMWGSRGIRRGGRTLRLVRHPDGRYDPDEVAAFLLERDRTDVPAPRTPQPERTPAR